APTTAELLVGLYEKVLPALADALDRHQRDTNPLADAPSVRVCRFARLEVGDMLDYGQRSIACLVDVAAREKMKDWLRLLDECLAAAGGLDGTSVRAGSVSDGCRTVAHASGSDETLAGAAGSLNTIARQYSAKPYVYDPIPKRDD